MVRSGAAPLIVYAFRRVRRSTEDATCEAPVHGEALESLNLMGKRRYYRHSGERARQKHQESADMRRRTRRNVSTIGAGAPDMPIGTC